jgi:hypothetical protein
MMSKANLMRFDSRDASQEHFVVQGRTCHINFPAVASLLGCFSAIQY